MAYEQRDNSGSLFNNDKKTDPRSNLPDRKGKAMINGQVFWVSGWIKEGKNGRFMSLSFTPEDESNVNRQQSKPKAIDDKDTPF